MGFFPNSLWIVLFNAEKFSIFRKSIYGLLHWLCLGVRPKKPLEQTRSWRHVFPHGFGNNFQCKIEWEWLKAPSWPYFLSHVGCCTSRWQVPQQRQNQTQQAASGTLLSGLVLYKYLLNKLIQFVLQEKNVLWRYSYQNGELKQIW